MSKRGVKMNQSKKKIQIPPRMLLRLQAIYDSLKRAERAAADLLMRDPEAVANSNIAALAKSINVSQPTFVRLAKHLGYSGFAELKDVLRQSGNEQSSKADVPYAHISTDTSGGDIARNIVRASIQALEDMLCVMDADAYDQAADAMIRADRLAFFGCGDSGIVARSAFQKFLRVGAICHTAEDFDTQLMLCSLLNERSVCLFVSHSGGTASIIQAAKLAKKSGAVTIAVTNFPHSHLAKLCDIVLLTATFVECNGEVATQRIAQLAIIESLYIIYRVRMSAQCEAALSITDSAIDSIQKS